MSGFTGRRASGASEQSGAEERVLTWGTSNAMLPLVAHIARDVLGHQERLAALYAEREQLDRTRHSLGWPERSRRYQVAEEVARVETSLRDVLRELDALGLTLLDPEQGLVGFPTMVNDRRAYFNWKPGEERLGFWCYAADLHRRPIPAEWTQEEIVEKPARKGRR